MRTSFVRVGWTLLCVLSLAALGAAQESAATEGADQLQTRWVDAWNQGDVPSISQLYTSDGDFLDISGERHQGPAAIETYLSELQAGPYKGAQISVTETATRMVKPNLLVRDGTWEMSGIEAPAEGEPPPSNGLYTMIAVQQGGEWRIAAHRARVAATPPASGQE